LNFRSLAASTAIRETVIPAVTKLGLSETLLWRARAGQARRVASMLSARDAALLEAYARECEDCARTASIENARANIRPSADIRRRDDQNPRPLVTSRRPTKAA
jgi:hypothetical protein